MNTCACSCALASLCEAYLSRGISPAHHAFGSQGKKSVRGGAHTYRFQGDTFYANFARRRENMTMRILAVRRFLETLRLMRPSRLRPLRPSCLAYMITHPQPVTNQNSCAFSCALTSLCEAYLSRGISPGNRNLPWEPARHAFGSQRKKSVRGGAHTYRFQGDTF